ncbi:MAG TPA: hypothetical protein VGS41_17675, partial [Chthonomonadales bacterium]|nr:hypothetical protein [Chthonomonadales bacterium]
MGEWTVSRTLLADYNHSAIQPSRLSRKRPLPYHAVCRPVSSPGGRAMLLALDAGNTNIVIGLYESAGPSARLVAD